MRKRTHNFAALAVFGMILSGAPAGAQTAGASPAERGNAENGKRLYLKYSCYACHAYDGHGGNGPKLAPRPTALPAFTVAVRRPPPGRMPVFSSKVLSDAELRDMWAFLGEIPESPAASTIPLLNP